MCMRDPTALMLPVTTVAIRCEVLLEKASATIFDTCWLSLVCLAFPFLGKRPLNPGVSPSPPKGFLQVGLLGLGPAGVGGDRGGGARLPARFCRCRRRRLQRGAVAGGRSWCDTTARLAGGAARKRSLCSSPALPGLGGRRRRNAASANSAVPRGALEAGWNKALASYSRSFPRKALESRFKEEFEAKDRQFSFCFFFFF